MADMTATGTDAPVAPIGTQVSALAAKAPDAPAVTCAGVTSTKSRPRWLWLVKMSLSVGERLVLVSMSSCSSSSSGGRLRFSVERM